jgi:ribose transport system substrate-binding protein
LRRRRENTHENRGNHDGNEEASVKRMIRRSGVWTMMAAMGIAAACLAGCKDEGTVISSGDNKGGAPSKRQVRKAPDGAALKLAFVTNNVSDFWKLAEAGVRQYEKEANVKVNFKMPPTGKVEEQNRFLEDLSTQGYHGIAISVIAADAQVPQINRAAAATNVITHDSDAPGSNRLAYIGTNNLEAGRRLGQEIVKLLPDGGKVALFVGQMSADNARQRYEGIKQAVAGKRIDLQQPKEDSKNPNDARRNVEDVINSQPDVKLLVGLWSYNGPAVANAIEASGKKGRILAAVFDEEEGTLKGIESGTISCTVVQKPYQFGYQSARLLHALATKGEQALPKDPMIDTGVDVINNQPSTAGSKNVAEFRAELAKLKGG